MYKEHCSLPLETTVLEGLSFVYILFDCQKPPLLAPPDTDCVSLALKWLREEDTGSSAWGGMAKLHHTPLRRKCIFKHASQGSCEWQASSLLLHIAVGEGGGAQGGDFRPGEMMRLLVDLPEPPCPT